MFLKSSRVINNLARSPLFCFRSQLAAIIRQRALHSNSNNPTEATRGSKTRVKPQIEPLCSCDNPSILNTCSKSAKCQYRVNQVPVFIKTYGCQMNENDTSIIIAILRDFGYIIVQDESKAEIHLLMTCAIRESAENKIWLRLKELGKRKEMKDTPLKQIGLLGCMAERLKEKALESSVDIVAGPDAYRDLPRLFAVNKLTREKVVNCLLSFDETYSDVRPVTNVDDVTSYISITRGCDNLCSYCIVPFTRGRERSRPISTILDEVRLLLNRGIKEVTLLGQNVNSYRDVSSEPEVLERPELKNVVNSKESPAEGFRTVYKPRLRGLTFDVLLEEVAKISPELRIRFTSPHPKDFNEDVIRVIRKYPNISRCIHLPAQSGSDKVLERMRRGYTKQVYLDLVDRMRTSIKNLSLTSDFIAGFCGETEEDHRETIDLIERVKYNFIYAFPYSLRDKTHAYHKFEDDVKIDVKQRRTNEIITLFREQALELNRRLIGSEQLVLVESESKRSNCDWQGRIDSNVKTILPKGMILDLTNPGKLSSIKVGDYVLSSITEANSQTLKAIPLCITSQAEFHQKAQALQFIKQRIQR